MAPQKLRNRSGKIRIQILFAVCLFSLLLSSVSLDPTVSTISALNTFIAPWSIVISFFAFMLAIVLLITYWPEQA